MAQGTTAWRSQGLKSFAYAALLCSRGPKWHTLLPHTWQPAGGSAKRMGGEMLLPLKGIPIPRNTQSFHSHLTAIRGGGGMVFVPGAHVSSWTRKFYYLRRRGNWYRCHLAISATVLSPCRIRSSMWTYFSNPLVLTHTGQHSPATRANHSLFVAVNLVVYTWGLLDLAHILVLFSQTFMSTSSPCTQPLSSSSAATSYLQLHSKPSFSP